jgi:hypothetical protein
VGTDRAIPNNKPDIIIRDYDKGTCMLTDTASSGDTNVINKEAEKILDLTTKVKLMLHVKTKVISVPTEATATIPNSFGQYLRNARGKHESKELPKIAILCTAHILRKVLM